jgi:hypothetical protein
MAPLLHHLFVLSLSVSLYCDRWLDQATICWPSPYSSSPPDSFSTFWLLLLLKLTGNNINQFTMSSVSVSIFTSPLVFLASIRFNFLCKKFDVYEYTYACSKIAPTYAQCYRLFIKLSLLFPQHVSASIYAIIRGCYYKLRKMCIK